jgi:hypothetical protein
MEHVKFLHILVMTKDILAFFQILGAVQWFVAEYETDIIYVQILQLFFYQK